MTTTAEQKESDATPAMTVTSSVSNDNEGAADVSKNEKPKQQKPSHLNSQVIAALPLPPDVGPNKYGRRCVQIYSATDQNDLVSIAAKQPGAEQASSVATSVSSDQTQP